MQGVVEQAFGELHGCFFFDLGIDRTAKEYPPLALSGFDSPRGTFFSNCWVIPCTAMDSI